MDQFRLTITDSGAEEAEPGPLNITRLARITGYSVSHLSRVFTRETNPSVGCLEKLSKALDLEMVILHQLIKKGDISVSAAN